MNKSQAGHLATSETLRHDLGVRVHKEFRGVSEGVMRVRDLAQARFVYLMSKVKLASLAGDDAVASVDDVNGSLLGVAK